MVMTENYAIMTLEKVFNQICSDNGGHKYSGWVKVGEDRFFSYGVQLSISDEYDDKLRILVYFVKNLFGLQHIFFQLRDSDTQKKPIFFYGSEYQKSFFEISPDEGFFTIFEGKEGYILSFHIESDQMTSGIVSKEKFSRKERLVAFCEGIIQKYQLFTPIEVGVREVPV